MFVSLFNLQLTLWCVFVFALAGFRRPVVIFGPIADAVNEKLAADLPNEFVLASKYLYRSSEQLVMSA